MEETKNGIELIAEERDRQIRAENSWHEHDKQRLQSVRNRVDKLIQAGANIAAEIDRILSETVDRTR